MEVEVLTGPPGCGKSTVLRNEAVAGLGLYLFAYPTEKLLLEQAAAFQSDMPPSSIVLEAHSGSPGRGVVQKKLDAAAAHVATSRAKHAVVLTTHASLMSADLSGYKGWHFRIDEAPAAIQSGREKSKIVREYLNEHFELAPVGSEGWHGVSPKAADAIATWRTDDGLSNGQVELLNNAQRPNRVFIEAPTFSRPFEWVSVWSPHALEGIAGSITIAGASYMTSIGGLVAEPHVEFRLRVLPMPRSGIPSIRIHYFTEGHEGSTSFWKRSEGRKFVVQLCDYLVSKRSDLGFWAANEPVAHLLEHRVSGVQLTPKAAGQNAHRDKMSCAYIYSARPTPNDTPLKALFGLTDDQIRVARQDEDILQFVMRGAIRNADYAGEYDIYLYSRTQAERLADQLSDSGVGKVEVVRADAGFMLASRSQSLGPTLPETVVSPTGRRVRRSSATRTERRHAKAVQEGRAPGRPGRPRKQ